MNEMQALIIALMDSANARIQLEQKVTKMERQIEEMQSPKVAKKKIEDAG